MLDLAIIGGGPAGLTAGMYATRGGLENVVMFEKGMPGGQITQSSEVENYPGVSEIVSGIDLMENWPAQCQRFGLKHEMLEVQSVRKEDNKFILDLGKESVEAKSVIVCTGSTPRKAGLNGEEEFSGKGVSYCATCDGFFYKGKEVVVVGGGDTALEEALYLAKICSKVTLVHRRDEFRASPTTIKRIDENEKIEVLTNANVDEIYGGAMGVDGVKVKTSTGLKDIPALGIFIFVGYNVNTQVLENGQQHICKLNDRGEIAVDLKMQTSLEGLFAAGDIRADAAKQVVCAAGDGATAAMSAISYVEGH
ncbi:MAG: thioredoxin-disulfide reductase [Campylobacterota bacterium]